VGKTNLLNTVLESLMMMTIFPMTGRNSHLMTVIGM